MELPRVSGDDVRAEPDARAPVRAAHRAPPACDERRALGAHRPPRQHGPRAAAAARAGRRRLRRRRRQPALPRGSRRPGWRGAVRPRRAHWSPRSSGLGCVYDEDMRHLGNCRGARQTRHPWADARPRWKATYRRHGLRSLRLSRNAQRRLPRMRAGRVAATLSGMSCVIAAPRWASRPKQRARRRGSAASQPRTGSPRRHRTRQRHPAVFPTDDRW